MATTHIDRRQCMEALARANEVRILRAGLKRDLKAGRVSAASVITDTPEWAEAMPLVVLLMAIPKFGSMKVNRIVRQMQVSNAKTLGGLSSRQRREIAALLRPCERSEAA